MANIKIEEDGPLQTLSGSVLKPVSGLQGVFRDPKTNDLVGTRDFVPLHKAVAFERGKRLSVSLTVPEGGTWVPDGFSVALHPWPEFIPPEVTIRVAFGVDLVVVDTPVFCVAEPVMRDQSLLRRLERLEQAMGVPPALRATVGAFRKNTGKYLLTSATVVSVGIQGVGLQDVCDTIVFKIFGVHRPGLTGI